MNPGNENGIDIACRGDIFLLLLYFKPFVKGLIMRLTMTALCFFGLVTAGFSQTAAPAGTAGMDWSTMALMLLCMFGIIFFFMIRPEQKKQKERQNMISAMAKGDKVLTIGGIYGKIIQVKENAVILKVADNTSIEFAKSSISAVINKEGAEKEDGKKKEEKSGE
jgi:preprotein translocase subunit YajC